MAACAPRTCMDPDGILASLSLPPARTHNFAAPSGPTSLERLGRYSLAMVRIASSLEVRLFAISRHLCPMSWMAFHSTSEGEWGGGFVPNLSEASLRLVESETIVGFCLYHCLNPRRGGAAPPIRCTLPPVWSMPTVIQIVRRPTYPIFYRYFLQPPLRPSLPVY